MLIFENNKSEVNMYVKCWHYHRSIIFFWMYLLDIENFWKRGRLIKWQIWTDFSLQENFSLWKYFFNLKFGLGIYGKMSSKVETVLYSVFFWKFACNGDFIMIWICFSNYNPGALSVPLLVLNKWLEHPFQQELENISRLLGLIHGDQL